MCSLFSKEPTPGIELVGALEVVGIGSLRDIPNELKKIIKKMKKADKVKWLCPVSRYYAMVVEQYKSTASSFYELRIAEKNQDYVP